MFQKLLISIANMLEKAGRKIKKHIRKKNLKQFLLTYSLQDGKMQKKSDIRYNPYEGTNLLIIDQLVVSGEIEREDSILDIGCGAGIFLIYLASKGFKNLYGVEIDRNLYELCLKNIRNFEDRYAGGKPQIRVVHDNGVEYDIDDSINCFYLFNTFYDKETYMAWLNNVKRSLDRRFRKIKIIILYPTVASMGAMRACDWLIEKGRIICQAQTCYQCVNCLIYESAESI